MILTLVAFLTFLPAISAKPNNKSLRIVVLGDSVTAGFGIDQKKAYPALIETSLKKKGFANIKIENAGISGSTSSSGSSRLRWLRRSKPIDIMVLQLGANDGLRGIDLKSTKTNLRKIISEAKTKKTKVVLAGMKIPPNYGKEYSTKFSKLYEELAKEEKLVFIPFLEDFHKKKNLVLPDGLHPNEKGHEYIATEVMKHLEPLL